MKKHLLKQFLMMLIPFTGAFAQNSDLDIRIAERLQPSEAKSLYKDYNYAVVDYNDMRKQYRRANGNNLLWALIGGITFGYLGYSYAGVDEADLALYAGAGFGGGFIVGRYMFDNGYRENKKEARSKYNYAMKTLPD